MQQLQQLWSKRPQQTASPAGAKTRTAALRGVKMLAQLVQIQRLTQLRKLLRSSSSWTSMVICLQMLLLQGQIPVKAQPTIKQIRSRRHLLLQQQLKCQQLWMLMQLLQGWISSKHQLVWRLLLLLPLTSACPRLLTQQHQTLLQQLLLLLL
jgi:hypothetical protein